MHFVAAYRPAPDGYGPNVPLNMSHCVRFFTLEEKHPTSKEDVFKIVFTMVDDITCYWVFASCMERDHQYATIFNTVTR